MVPLLSGVFAGDGAGEDNRRVIQGMVELRGCVTILKAGAG
jgi:hypothetical protein